MNELIKVDINENQEPVISGRELYKALEATERYNNWFDRMLQYGFAENYDFTSVKSFTLVNNGANREIDDHILKLDMAKEIAMLQRNEKGKRIRKYFIEVEKEFNSPSKVMARGLLIADKTIKEQNKHIQNLEYKIEQDKNKVEFYDDVIDSTTTFEISKVAKMLNFINIGRNNLFEILREQGILQRDNVPYQNYIDRGWFRLIETKYTKPNGDIQLNYKTVVYQKGIEQISKLLKWLGFIKYEQLGAWKCLMQK